MNCLIKSNDVNDEVFDLYPVTCMKSPLFTVDILVNDNNIPMEIETGASLTIGSNATFKKLNRDEKLIVNPFSGKLKTNWRNHYYYWRSGNRR